MCYYGRDLESTSHFFLYCLTFPTERHIFLSALNDIGQNCYEMQIRL